MGNSVSFGGAAPVRAHLLRGGGKGREIEDLRQDIDAAFLLLEDVVLESEEIPLTALGVGSAWVPLWTTSGLVTSLAVGRVFRVGFGVAIKVPASSEYVDLVGIALNIARGADLGGENYRFTDVDTGTASLSDNASVTGSMTGAVTAQSVNWRIVISSGEALLELQQDAAVDVSIGLRQWKTAPFGA